MLTYDRINIFWFRRDLRLTDNHGLFRALEAGLPVVCIFIFDKNILDRLENRHDRRVSFIYRQVEKIKNELEQAGSSLLTRYGKPPDIFKDLADHLNIQAVYTNEDYEPEALKRDEDISKLLAAKKIGFNAFKDQVIFSKFEIVKPNGEPYTIFTPYSKKWLAAAESDPGSLQSFPSEKLSACFLKFDPEPLIPLASAGFEEIDPGVRPIKDDPLTLQQYGANRDKLFADATSHAGVHLRFGTISIRDLARKGFQ
ncbi:MAG: deoxyribodipyrimidine photo-lyase, partial [Chitinophagaceae bacterium]